jgi:1-acyl-sn-glycerol-3-phosphate acyltransferase
MIHAIALKVPYFSRILTKLGAVPANKENARMVLKSGYPLLLCPGGDVDSLKPFNKRHHICFGERRGFIRLAIEQQVPIIPIVSVGAHETLFILNDGRWLAEISGAAEYLRIKTIPFSLSFPFGLTPAGLLSIPLPSKIRIQILPKIELHELPQASNNTAVVERCFEHIRGKMQKALDELASTRKHIIFG